MPRIRTIKPDFFVSEKIAKLSLTAERTFLGILTLADDEGRLKAGPEVLNGALWPLRPEHTVDQMREDLAQLEAVGLLCRYEVDGRTYRHVTRFRVHQRINRPTPSKLPPCPIHDTPPPPAPGPDGQGVLLEVPAAAPATPARTAVPAGTTRTQPSPPLDVDTRNFAAGAATDEPPAELSRTPSAGEVSTDTTGKRQTAKKRTRAGWTDERKKLAREIVQAWWETYGRGQSQSWIAIFSVVVSALGNGVPVDALKDALDVLGKRKKPISGGAIQIVLSQRASTTGSFVEQQARRDASYYTTQL